MTHEEKIAALTGEYLQVSQYTLYTAFKAAEVYVQSLKNTAYRHGSEELNLAYASADTKLRESQGASDKELLAYFQDKGFSIKILKGLEQLLKDRSYFISSFFISHSSDFASQDVKAYDDIIAEIQSLITRAVKLNQELSKTLDKVSSLYY